MDASPPPAPVPWPERLRTWLSPPSRAVAALGSAVAVATVAVLVLRPPPDPGGPLALPRIPADADAAGVPDSGGVPAGGGGAPGEGAAVGAGSTVHVAGAVAHPGVYVLARGARVADALAAAGGALPEAALDLLNLAAPVGDGERVWVPRPSDPPGGPSGGSGPGREAPAPATVPVDLNTATLEQLDALPGVGPATAQAIVSYRQRVGRFRAVSELLDVPGIGPAKLETLRPLVRT